MGQIYSFSFSKPGIQINPGQITALLKHPSKAEISKRPPGIKKIVSSASFTIQRSSKMIKEKYGCSSGLGTN